MNRIKMIVGLFVLLCLAGCDGLVTKFESEEKGILYKADHSIDPPTSADTLTVMTWNIRFGARRLGWFGDACGDRVILSEDEVMLGLEGIANKIWELQPDILFLEEVDVESKRTGYIDQMQWLLDHTYFNYGAYASMWQAQYVPSEGLGRINTGNAILSRWKITDAKRIQLALRSDQDALTKYFYLRRNLLIAKIAIPGLDNFYGACIHAEAFSTDDTKKKHVEQCVEELTKITDDDGLFILGGDFNLLPPGSDSTDFCDEDGCSDEHFHGKNDDPLHKDGSNYTPEITWLQPMYDNFSCAVPLAEFQSDQLHHFTHTTIHPDGYWNRTLDYLFANVDFIAGSDSTHQEAIPLSDHCPVTAKWRAPK